MKISIRKALVLHPSDDMGVWICSSGFEGLYHVIEETAYDDEKNPGEHFRYTIEQISNRYNIPVEELKQLFK